MAGSGPDKLHAEHVSQKGALPDADVVAETFLT
jgi:hypothetical protein